MSPSVSVPKDLAKWIEERARLMAELAEQVEAIAKHDKRDRQAWTLNLLEEASEIETHARRVVHLLTAYALREQLASPTVVAKRSAVTITGAQNRAGSRLAQEVWSEVFGSNG